MRSKIYRRGLLYTIFISSLITACHTSKMATGENLYGPTWELEYLSGPRIAFEALFKEKKPQIVFDKTSMRAEGNDGCNGYSAPFTLNVRKISFGEPGPTTMMYCGEGEQFFLQTIKKIETYKIDHEGKLHLMMDDVTMMRFKKNM